MSLTVGLSCGHGMRLLGVHDTPPDGEPWTMYPLIEEHPVDVGDAMTCIVCLTEQRVTGCSPELIPMDHTGRLSL